MRRGVRPRAAGDREAPPGHHLPPSGAGVSDDFPLARMYAGLRTLRFADGPDEVHRRQLARAELGKYA